MAKPGSPHMVYPFPIYAGMPIRFKWRLAYRCARVLKSDTLPEDVQASAASASIMVPFEFTDAQRLLEGRPALYQEYGLKSPHRTHGGC